MQKSGLRRLVVLCAATVWVIFFAANCGKSECRRYNDKFCADENSETCRQAKERSKNWSADTCRIERNKLEIEEQSKSLDKELSE